MTNAFECRETASRRRRSSSGLQAPLLIWLSNLIHRFLVSARKCQGRHSSPNYNQSASREPLLLRPGSFVAMARQFCPLPRSAVSHGLLEILLTLDIPRFGCWEIDYLDWLPRIVVHDPPPLTTIFEPSVVARLQCCCSCGLDIDDYLQSELEMTSF